MGVWFGMCVLEFGLRMIIDCNGNMWVWWGELGLDVIVIGSYFDFVFGGGVFDGLFGVVSVFDVVKVF